jgi:hypothetical protein
MNPLVKKLRSLLRDTPAADLRDRIQNDRLISAWKASGMPAPPPEIIKRNVLSTYGQAFALNTLIETGTFQGQTPYVLRDRFKSIYSIELSSELAARATERFRSRPHIHILQGDSGELLPRLLASITEPCLFWLDGHYSGGETAQGNLDTPILKELDTIFSHRASGHVVLIDDARLFNGTQDYPTLEQLQAKFASDAPSYEFSVRNDIIRAHPPKDVASTY